MKKLPALALLLVACTSSPSQPAPARSGPEPVSERQGAALRARQDETPLAAAVPAPAVAPAPSVAPAAAAPAQAAPRLELAQDYVAARKRAEALYAQGSYALAREVYAGVDADALPREEKRWVEFRMADTLWRAQAATDTADPSTFVAAQEALDHLVRDVKRDEDQDRVFAEVQESLGDFSWARRGSQDWGTAWPRYQSALAWWGRATDVELSRARYLGIVWKLAPLAEIEQRMGWFGIQVPDEVLENAIAIAQTPQDKARAHLIRGLVLRDRGGDLRSVNRVPRELKEAIALGRDQDWYDDALFFLADWYENRGEMVRDANGGWRNRPDYVAALALYRRIEEEFKKGASRWRDDAVQRADNILRPSLSVAAGSVFLPGSEVALSLSWRNVAHVDFRLVRVDLLRDVNFAGEQSGGDYLTGIDVAGKETVASWSRETGDTGDHAWGADQLRIERKLELGAYVLVATAPGVSARELVLVTDVALVLKSARGRTLTWFTDALTGAPVGAADVRLLERWYDGRQWRWRERTQKTGDDGLSLFDRAETAQNQELFAIARLGSRTAFSAGSGWGGERPGQGWRIEALTDRPAYRPEDKVSWKILARRFDGARYATPAGEKLDWVVLDPQGAKVHEGTAELSAFGSAWGELELSAKMTLGEYRIQFERPRSDEVIGGATLFRLEEYKLPEFKVAVETPRVGGRPRTFRLGDTVEVDVAADLYSGGPVAGAQVEVIVHQSPFGLWYQEPRAYPWLYTERSSFQPWRYGGDTIVKRATLATDALGRAHLSFDTPQDSQTDLQYRIEARVVDASRREVVGNGEVKVARQSYSAWPRPRHNLYRPGDKVEIDVKTIDANQQPVAAQGKLAVWRQRWFESWLDPRGQEHKGSEPWRASEPDKASAPEGWLLLSRGYRRDAITTLDVSTDAKGEGRASFAVATDGAYEIEWTSTDVDGSTITGACSVWVASDRTTDLEWRRGALELIVDRDTLKSGEDALAMISTASSGAWVLFAVESEDLLSWQVVHLDGTAKLMRVRLDDRHVPNTYLSAEMVRSGQIWSAIEELIVPPVEQFLSVDVTPADAEVRPGTPATMTVTARDSTGAPVAAEIAFSVLDEAVLAIQQEYDSDPRAFFWGDKKARWIQDSSSFQSRRYARLVRGKDGALVDERLASAGGDAQEWEREGDRKDRGLRQESRDSFEGKEERLGMLADSPSVSKLSMAKAGAYRGAGDTVPAGSAGGEDAVRVRSDFRATACWKPDAVTGADGKASVTFVWPETLTGWKARAVAATRESRFGVGEAKARTNLPLTVRLQAPRFFVVGDDVTLSALVRNNGSEPLQVACTIACEGLELEAADSAPITIAAGAEARIDRTAHARAPGTAKIVATARAGKDSDAMEKSYPVLERGIDQLLVRSGKLDGDAATIAIDLPAARRATRFTVRIAPSLAVTMLDALPYLVDYPYGCTEQTMSRFLPAAIVAKTLGDLGLDPEAAMGRVFGGIEPSTADKTHARKGDLAKLAEVQRLALERLYDFQHADGGWGWWKQGESDPYMSAYVVWGLALARSAGIEVSADAEARGAAWLDLQLVEAEGAPDLAAWELHALAAHARATRGAPSEFARKAFERLWNERDGLNAYTRALFALAAHDFGYAEQAQVLVDNLVNGVAIDRTPDVSVVQQGVQTSQPLVQATAHWGRDGVCRRWSDGAVESSATALRALLAIRPGHELIAPVTNWLIRNRRGAQWSSTRDTAIVVLALNDYLKTSGELGRAVEYSLSVDGRPVATRKLAPDELLAAPASFEIDPAWLRDGPNEVRLEKRSAGPLYFAVEARFFSLEDPIQPAGNEIFVRREYWRIVPVPTLLAGWIEEKHRLASGDAVASGDRIETVIVVEAKNDLEYLMIEDLKPAGLEAVSLRSGEPLDAREIASSALARRLAAVRATSSDSDAGDFTGRTRGAHQELRDRKVAMFLDKLAQGTWELRYEMRAEVPGRFHALPAIGQAMYVPEIRGNGLETIFVVQ